MIPREGLWVPPGDLLSRVFFRRLLFQSYCISGKLGSMADERQTDTHTRTRTRTSNTLTHAHTRTFARTHQILSLTHTQTLTRARTHQILSLRCTHTVARARTPGRMYTPIRMAYMLHTKHDANTQQASLLCEQQMKADATPQPFMLLPLPALSLSLDR